jgi:hypothetical protein
MGAKRAERGRERRSQSANTNNASRRESHRIAKLTAVALVAAAALCPSLRAQSLHNDPSAPNMSGVTDVTPGWKYLLQNDDLAMVQFTQASDGTLTTSLVTMNTSNSNLSGTPQTVTISSSNPGVDSTKGIVASEASGRIFNSGTDMIAVLTAVQGGWKVTLANSTGAQSSSQLKSSFPPTALPTRR